MLGKSKSRHEMIDKGLTRSHKLTFNRIFGDYRREVELYSIAKSIQALASSKKVSPMKVETHHHGTLINTSSEAPSAPNVAFGRTSNVTNSNIMRATHAS